MGRKVSFIRNCTFAILFCAVSFLLAFPITRAAAKAQGEHASFEHGDAISFSAAGGNIDAGDYYLDRNLTVAGTFIVTEGVVNLCLNGFTMSYAGAIGSVFVIDGGTLNIYDCSESEGEITGGKGTDGNGGGIYIRSGTLNLYGGAISANSATYGAGICNEGGTFNMYGGAVINNVVSGADGEGAGINISNGGIFNMRGGHVSGNKGALNGGGVYICEYGDKSGSVFNMYGGSITGNSAISGGGVYLKDGSSTFAVSGAVQITDNKSGTSSNNVYLDITDGNKKLIRVIGALKSGSETACIGVSLSDSYVGAFTSGYGAHNDGEEPSTYFVCDRTGKFCSTYGVEVAVTDSLSIDIDGIVTNWTVNGSTALGSGDVYRYSSSDGTERWFGSEQSSTDLTLMDSATVTGSIARFIRGETLTVELTDGINSDSYTAEYSGNAANGYGKFFAQATLTADSGVLFTSSRSDLTIDSPYGVRVVISDGGRTANITKVWYVVASDNELLNEAKSIADRAPRAYSIADFTFGQSVEFAVPRLKRGAPSDNARITFALHRNNVVIASGVNISDFAEYLNPSMPSGAYTLSFNAPSVNVAAGSNWWDGSAEESGSCSSFTVDYVFNVMPAQVILWLDRDPQTGYLDYEWEYDAADKSGFFDKFQAAVSKSGAVELTEVTRSGYWNTTAGSKYYGEPTVTYNFARIYDNTYRTPDDADIRQNIKGGANGTYKVYFKVNAPNHADITSGGSDRYSFFFTVTVYETVDVPQISDMVYTGTKNLPTVQDDSLYEMVFDKDDDYISGGTHYVTLKLRDSEHYRWKQPFSSEDGTARVSFKVSPAKNTWLRSPNIVGWEYGSYDRKANYIVAIPTYADGEDSVVFAVSKTADGSSPMQGLENFTVDADGFVSEDVAADIAKLPAGTYWLVSEVPATANYTAATTQYTEFKVIKAVNYWATAPSIASWVKGEYDSAEAAISASPRVGDVVVKIVDGDGKVWYDSSNGTDDLKKAPVGSYIMIATVAETDSHYGLEHSVSFRIFAHGGLPWWAILLIVLGAMLIVFLVFFILVKKGVVQLVTEKMVVAIRTRADTDATIAAVRAGKIAAEAERAAEVARAAEAAAAALDADDAASDAEEALPEEQDDTEETVAYEPEENDEEVPSSVGFAKVFEFSSSERVTYGKTVLSKLITATDVVKNRYSELKNYMLSYKKARANMSRARESFYLGRKCYARIAVRGKTLCLYLALNPANYAERYKVEDVLAVKQYVDTPCLLRIRSDRAVRHAKTLIDELMASIGAVAVDRKPENYAELFKSIEQLEKKRLLSYSGKKQKSVPPRGN